MTEELKLTFALVAVVIIGPGVSIALGFFARAWFAAIAEKLSELKKSHETLLEEFRSLERQDVAPLKSDARILALQLNQSALEIGELRKLKQDVDSAHAKIRALELSRADQ